MTEIEKLYSFAGIKPTVRNTAIGRGYYIEHQTVEEYPPFTPEKQLELIKWLIKYDELHADFNDNEYGFSSLNYSGNYKKDFAEALASVINFELWQDLTKEDKTCIKNILEI